jgi:hypothetical protein
MTSNSVVAFCLGALVAAASAIATAQQTTVTPGQMTQARVFVENHGPGEAVPIDLVDANMSAPLRVQVINADAAHGSVAPVAVRAARATWEYATTNVQAGQDAVGILNGRGAEGWEIIGVTLPATGGMTFILKRVR